MLLKQLFVENRSRPTVPNLPFKSRRKKKGRVDCSDPSFINRDKALERVSEHQQNMSCDEAGGVAVGLDDGWWFGRIMPEKTNEVLPGERRNEKKTKRYLNKPFQNYYFLLFADMLSPHTIQGWLHSTKKKKKRKTKKRGG